MGDAADKESRTELPTDKRRQDAIERGNVPISREVVNFGFMVALLITLTSAPSLCRSVMQVLRSFLERPGEFSLETAADASLLVKALSIELISALWIFIVFMVLGIGAVVVQSPPQLAIKRIALDFSRVSVRQGWKRIASSQGTIEVVKSVLKLTVIGAIGATFVLSSDPKLPLSPDIPLDALPGVISHAMSSVVWQVAGIAMAIAIADLLMTRVNWEKQLRMTKQEVRDELRQQDGDRVLISRRRSIARNRVRKRMMARVPRATLVVVNPTHYAVALRYRREEDGAPRVIAKGTDLIALQIRKVAEQHAIPVVENKALARSLYKAVEVDQTIPTEFYRAVAEIIILLRKQRSRRAAVPLGG